LGVIAFEVPGRTWPEAGERACPEPAGWACPELAGRSGTKVSSDAGCGPELVERPCPELAEGTCPELVEGNWLVVPAVGGFVRREITRSIASCNSAGVWGRSFGSFANILSSRSTTGTCKFSNSLPGGGFTKCATSNLPTAPMNG